MKKGLIIFLSICTVFYATAQGLADSGFYQMKQSQWLAKKTGAWEVTMILQPKADAPPMTIKGIVAERTMVGAFCLHENMHPSKADGMPGFQRISDLDYNYNDARWDYMSVDSRITAGIMYFSNEPDTKDSIVSFMLNTVHPGFGPQQTDRGKNMRVRNVIISLGPDHDIVKQYWKLTDGDEWLAVLYDYSRKK